MGVLTTRRKFLEVVSTAACASCLSGVVDVKASEEAPKKSGANDDELRYCLNLGTIREYNLPLPEEIAIAKEAGYRSVEIWIDRLADYARDGQNDFSSGKLAELKKYLDGEGVRIEGGIGFATWIMNEPDRRQAGLDEIKRQAEALAALGAKCIAAPAAGPWNEKIEGIEIIAERYEAVLNVCKSFGVRALLELWGASPTLSRLSDGLAICAETRDDQAGLLLDVYHLYRGGNSFESLNLVAGSALPIFHLNDYPSEPEREKLTDADRVFPGDGIAPYPYILATLKKNGFKGALSLELFNKTYRKTYSALEQAKKGLEKMRALVEA